MTGRSSLRGEIAIVTGAAGGIGLATARLLHERGASVVMTDRLPEPPGDLPQGNRLVYCRLDVTDAADWSSVIAETERAFGSVSVLVNNAGVIEWDTDIETMPVSDFRRTLEVNLVGPLRGIQHVIPGMRVRGGGSIINLSSVAGLVGGRGISGYVASKFGVRGLTKAAAAELGQWNIRVNSVHPGQVDTAMTRDLPAPRRQPLARWGRPDEVAALIGFLASAESSYSTGAEFVADGGATAVM